MVVPKKYILITLFSLLMLFGAGGEVRAIDVSNFNCGRSEIEGTRFAIFADASDGMVEIKCSHDGKENVMSVDPSAWFNDVEVDAKCNVLGPDSGDLTCVLVKENQTTIDFDGLKNAGILSIDFADNEYSDQNLTMRGDNFTQRDFMWDGNAIQMIVKLQTIADGPEGTGGRLRYRIQKDGGGDAYIYFMGFANPNASGAITAIPKEKCWEMDGDKTLCDKKYPDQCFWYEIPNDHKCQSRLDPAICEKLPINLCGTKEGSQACKYDETEKRCYTILQSSIATAYDTPAGYNGPLPACAFRGDCKDTNDIVQLVVNFVANILLPFVGGAVFIMFVYGGFTIILSFGNPEKVKKGWGILIAALVGMAIVFGAFLLLDFVFDSLNLSAGFRGFSR